MLFIFLLFLLLFPRFFTRVCARFRMYIWTRCAGAPGPPLTPVIIGGWSRLPQEGNGGGQRSIIEVTADEAVGVALALGRQVYVGDDVWEGGRVSRNGNLDLSWCIRGSPGVL